MAFGTYFLALAILSLFLHCASAVSSQGGGYRGAVFTAGATDYEDDVYSREGGGKGYGDEVYRDGREIGRFDGGTSKSWRDGGKGKDGETLFILVPLYRVAGHRGGYGGVRGTAYGGGYGYHEGGKVETEIRAYSRGSDNGGDSEGGKNNDRIRVITLDGNDHSDLDEGKRVFDGFILVGGGYDKEKNSGNKDGYPRLIFSGGGYSGRNRGPTRGGYETEGKVNGGFYDNEKGGGPIESIRISLSKLLGNRGGSQGSYGYGGGDGKERGANRY